MQCPLYILVLIGLKRKRMDEYQNRTEHKMIYFFKLKHTQVIFGNTHKYIEST